MKRGWNASGRTARSQLGRTSTVPRRWARRRSVAVEPEQTEVVVAVLARRRQRLCQQRRRRPAAADFGGQLRARSSGDDTSAKMAGALRLDRVGQIGERRLDWAAVLVPGIAAPITPKP